MTRAMIVIEDMINHTNRHGRGLTDWETKFMDSLTVQFERTQNISDKQEAILERIYSDRT